MLTVTIKLKSDFPPIDGWYLFYGPNYPYEQHINDWSGTDAVSVADPLTVSMDEATRYIKVFIRDGVTQRDKYHFATTDPFVFEDKTTYIWDYSTNSLSKEEPEPVPVKPIDVIFSFVWDISDWFLKLAQNIPDWLDPLGWFSTPILWVSDVFFDLLTPIANLGVWVDDVATKVSDILSSVDIIKLLQTWLTYAEDAWGWVKDATTNVTDIIGTWWGSASLTVESWIDIAKTTLEDLIDTLSSSLATLQTAWDAFKDNIPSLDEVILWWGDWWEEILTPLTTWWDERLEDVQALIDSTLKTWLPFYDDLVNLWDSIADFFTNPLDWIEGKFIDWFLGPED